MAIRVCRVRVELLTEMFDIAEVETMLPRHSARCCVDDSLTSVVEPARNETTVLCTNHSGADR